MYKHATFTLASVLACSTAMFAQTTPTTAPQQTGKDMKPGSVMVTGCVAQGTKPDTFMLTNAVRADASDKDTMPTPDKTKADPTMTMSYDLVGGDKLKAHVGHKVTVTGMPDKMETMGGEKSAMGRPSSPEGATGAAHDMKGGTLKVEAVKMVSTTCP